MASLRDIRDRIGSVKSTQQVTRAMKMVAAAKLRRAQERIFQTRPYAFSLGGIINHLKHQLDPGAHPLFQQREDAGGVLLIVITADRGLAGAFNANIIKLVEATIEERFADAKRAGELYLLAAGRKGREYFTKRGYKMVGDYRGVFDDLSFSTPSRIVADATAGFEEGRWDQVFVIYNEFRNTISQNRIVEPVLPIPAERFLTPIMERDATDTAPGLPTVDYIYEPSPEDILESLVPQYLRYTIWRALLESNAAEQGARMVAMDNATNNADELLRDLRLKYNRARQDAITTEIIEITSGANALEEA